MKHTIILLVFILTAVAGFTGTRPDWLDIKNQPVFDIRQYGAKAGDSTSDTSAIQAAVNAAITVGGIVLIPTGEFNLASPILVPFGNKKIKIMGSGWGSKLKTTVATDAIQLLSEIPLTNYDSRAKWVEISDLSLVGVVGSSGAGIMASGTGGLYIDHVFVSHFARGLDISYSSEIFIDRLWAENNTVGVYLAKGGNGVVGADCLVRLTNGVYAGNTSDQIVLNGVRIATIEKSTFSSGTNAGVLLTTDALNVICEAVSITDCFFESEPTGTHVKVAGRTNILNIDKCTFVDSAPGTPTKITIASGATTINIANSIIGMAYTPAIKIKSTQDSSLRLTMTNNVREEGSKFVPHVSILDERTDGWHFETLPSSNFGTPLILNSNFVKGVAGWSLSNIHTTIASDSLLGYNFLQLEATATPTQGIAYIPFYINNDDYKNAFVDIIVNANSPSIAQSAISVLVSDRDGGNLRASDNFYSVQHQIIGSSTRILGSCQIEANEILRGVSVNNSTNPGELMYCTYLQLFCNGKAPQTTLDLWDTGYAVGGVATPTIGFWEDGDRLYLRGRVLAPVTTGGFVYASGTWHIFQ